MPFMFQNDISGITKYAYFGILGLGFIFSFPPIGIVCITPLLILIFGKKEFIKRFV